MSQCPLGAFQNPEATSPDDDPDIRTNLSEIRDLARLPGERSPTETPDEKKDHERKRRGAETPTRVTTPQEQSLQSDFTHPSAGHVPRTCLHTKRIGVLLHWSSELGGGAGTPRTALTADLTPGNSRGRAGHAAGRNGREETASGERRRVRLGPGAEIERLLASPPCAPQHRR
ncbi:hypothetical protein NDU88_001293 [Pleurodeles waltl]|uniref:Uncharacterized protein n=1 Tax=Pleurodeles waltl TaxID=8319 RepID=A0AAV7USD8_PLEWA|nr:hypothetical protein NDU88_001293 [Pleurodeles waltl]